MHLIAQLLPGFAYNCPTVTTQFVTDIRLRYFLIPLQLWENKKMWDLKLLLYAIHPGWHESMVLSVSHDSGDSWTVQDCRKELWEMRPFTKKSLDNSLCGYKTVKLSEDNSGTEPRVQHLAKLAWMLLALASGLESGEESYGEKA